MNLIKQFESRYQSIPSHRVRSPGRVNLIGEHTDYNHGFVLPIAIEQAIEILFSPRQDNIISITLSASNETQSFCLDDANMNCSSWVRYAKAAVQALHQQYSCNTGFNAIISSTLPQGAGLSSSAALLLGLMQCLSMSNQIVWDPIAMAQLAQYAENHFVGVNCGIMDQMIISNAQAGHALKIDCQDLTLTHIPLPDNIDFIIMDTSTRRGLVESEYNDRRDHCEQAARNLKVATLRDADLLNLKQQTSKLSKKQFQYAHHVITENTRVISATAALKEQDISKFGTYLNESHASLKNDFNVSTPALNALVEIAQNTPGCYGARMTGAGFGGCAIAVIEKQHNALFHQSVIDQYYDRTQLKAALYQTSATAAVTNCAIFDRELQDREHFN